MRSVQVAPESKDTDGVFYTNRCSKCGRALTKLEIVSRMNDPRPLCPCGSNKFHSANFKWWEEVLLPRSWRMWVAIRRGDLAPAPMASDVKSNRDSMIKQVANLESDGDFMIGED